MSTAWSRFFVLYAIQFLQLIDFMSIAPTGAIFHKDGYIDSNTIAFSITAYSIAAILGSLVIRKFENPNSIHLLKKMLIVFSLSQLVLLIGINNNSFIFARILGGLTGGLIGAIAYSKLHLIEDGKNTGLWNGRVQTAQSLITLIGIPMCLLIITKLDTKVYYFLTFILSLILPFNLKVFSIANESNLKNDKIAFNVFKNLDILLTGFFCYLSAFLFITNLPNYLINEKNISADQLSVAYATSGIITILIAGSLGKIADSINPKILLFISIVLISLIQVGFFRFSTISSLFLMLPAYLLLSTARMIYQRSIILRKKDQDIASMHILNNICIRAGVLSSGLIIGYIVSRQSLALSIKLTNRYSIYSSILTLLFVFGFLLKEKITISQKS